jgi:hypothetical protein
MDSTLPINQKKLGHFAGLTLTQKKALLTKKACLLDSDEEKGDIVNLYFLEGFFVEEIICANTQTIKDIIPYKSGFRLSHYKRASQPSMIINPFKGISNFKKTLLSLCLN